jgi:DNA-binding MarR family transcriptional regulator/GNAT superfamily N-acetyltransferase
MKKATVAQGEPVDTDDIESVRAFNRFYTRQAGLLDQGLLGSEYTLTEARVLYELAHRDECTATKLTHDLGIDAGYLSRILKKLERSRLIKRRRSATDGRQSAIVLTPRGRAAFEPLDRAARADVDAMLKPMSGPQRRELVSAMRTVHRVLRPEGSSLSAPACTLRDLKVGDIGWIIRRQGMLYATEYGWDGTYEALVAEILAGFVKNFDPTTEQAIIAEKDSVVVGSVFLVHESPEVAKLRLLYVEPHTRGLGIGRSLLQACIEAARARGYRTLTLWTNDILVAARRLYQAAGFRLTREEPHHSFGRDLIGQTWELAL